jgi:DNA-binding MarR family transcriptional regulator
VTLNIGTTLKTPTTAKPASAKPATAKRPAASTRPLVRDVLEELSSWNPREFIAAFQRWHQGSISLTHLNVLSILEANGALSMSGVADALDISVASATGVVDRMEARGLVKRRRHPEDRRVVLVETAAGARKVFHDIDSRRRKGLAKILSKLTDAELEGLLAGHRALRAARADVARERIAGESEGTK